MIERLILLFMVRCKIFISKLKNQKLLSLENQSRKMMTVA